MRKLEKRHVRSCWNLSSQKNSAFKDEVVGSHPLPLKGCTISIYKGNNRNTFLSICFEGDKKNLGCERVPQKKNVGKTLKMLFLYRCQSSRSAVCFELSFCSNRKVLAKQTVLTWIAFTSPKVIEDNHVSNLWILLISIKKGSFLKAFCQI